MQFSIYTVTVTLCLIMDPLGNVPLFQVLLKEYPKEKQRRIIIRETLIAFFVLLLFLLAGRVIMRSLGLELPALSVGGGIVLFMIAVKMLFPTQQNERNDSLDSEPFVVPMAIPLTAGPSSLAMIMLYASRYPDQQLGLILALFISTMVFFVIVMSGNILMRYLGERGLVAMERLMGMVLVTLAVQMFLHGIHDFIKMQGS